jgi:hypothetical protein
MKKATMLKNLQKLNLSTKLPWAFSQVLTDILIAFCLSLIVAKTARRKLLATKKAWRCGGIWKTSAHNCCLVLF